MVPPIVSDASNELFGTSRLSLNPKTEMPEPEGSIAERLSSGDVGPDEVAFDQVARTAHLNAITCVPRDDVAGTGGRSTDRVVIAADGNADGACPNRFVPVTSVPIRLPSTRLSEPESTSPSPKTFEIRFRAPGVVPPMVLFELPSTIPEPVIGPPVPVA